MIDKNDALYKDFEAVKQIQIVPTMLDSMLRIATVIEVKMVLS